MRKPKPATPAARKRASKKARRLFLEHLAESANVTASANVGGIDASTAYRLRNTDPEFADAWQVALTQGYVRLETTLLEEALQRASGATKDRTLRSRDQKYGLGLKLLAAHRASVLREAPSRPIAKSSFCPRAAMEARLMQMHARLTASTANDQ